MENNRVLSLVQTPVTASYRVMDFPEVPTFEVTVNGETQIILVCRFPSEKSLVEELAEEVRSKFNIPKSRTLVMHNVTKLVEFFEKPQAEKTKLELAGYYLMREVRFIINLLIGIPLAFADAALSMVMFPPLVFWENFKKLMRNNDGESWFWEMRF